MLVGRYESRLLAFCRHLLGSREDAEDVLQEVFTAAFNALLADDRPINVRPWLYRIARNRSLNHLRRTQAIGVDSMDVHLSEHGASTADKVHEREEFRLLVGDIHELPETQKTALVLREMDALSYEQIAEVMETTVPSVKSLLVRARVSLAEAAEARLLSCDEVRIELGEIAEGLRRRPSPLVRRHLKACDALLAASRSSSSRPTRRSPRCCRSARSRVLRKLAFVHLGHSAGSAGTGAAAGSAAAAAGSGAAAGSAPRSQPGSPPPARRRAASSPPASAPSRPRRPSGSRPRRSSPAPRSRSTARRSPAPAPSGLARSPSSRRPPASRAAPAASPALQPATANQRHARELDDRKRHKQTTAGKKSTVTAPALLASTGKAPVTPATTTPATTPPTARPRRRCPAAPRRRPIRPC